MNLERSRAIAELICTKLERQCDSLKTGYHNTKEKIGFFFIDDILPHDLAEKCFNVFPHKSEMQLLKSIREHKYISAQMNRHNELLEDVLYAFQDQNVVDIVGKITEIKKLYADESLYAGGLSLMSNNNFLNPHLDNSHDSKRQRWRVLNLLYYVTPDWKLNNGGHLELWPDGPKKEPILIESKFNRLVVMATHCDSWHSVNKVRSLNKSRCCISNYYFSRDALKESDRFHVTKFRGRPNENLKNFILDIDSGVRMTVRKFFKKGIRENPHIYKDKVKD